MVILLFPYAMGVVAPAFAFFALLSTGIGPLDVSLADSIWSKRVVIALIDTWQWIGILLVASLFKINQIPRSYFQMADLEGMGRWTRWRLIIWPEIRYVFIFYMVFRFLDWMRKVDAIRALYNRGPAGALQTIAMYIGQVYFEAAQAAPGSLAGIQNPYGGFLALLQISILIAAAIFISRRKIVSDLYSAGSLAKCAVEKTQSQTYRKYIGVSLFWLVFFLIIVGPLLWIFFLSLQNVNLSGAVNLRFHLIPAHPTLDAYKSILSGSKGYAQGIITQATKLFSSSELKSLKMHCLGFRHGNH